VQQVSNQYVTVEHDGIGGAVLACPVCDKKGHVPSTCVHPIGIDVYSPGKREGHLRVDKNGITINPKFSNNNRGVSFFLDFQCENGHTFSYKYLFHKGATIIDKIIHDDEDIDPINIDFETIWRD